MPELPEVETVVRTLENFIKNQEIKDIKIHYDRIVENEIEEFKNRLTNQHFIGFQRRGKYIILQMDDVDLIVHLRMEGKFYVKNHNDEFNKHTHIQFYLDNNLRLDYHDTRKFGRMKIEEKRDNYDVFKNLGPEPFSPSFNENYVKNKIQSKTIALKKILLDQSFVAGIGNIYADEICFKMKCHPLFPVNKLSKKKRIELIESTRLVLAKAIEAGGSTIRSYTSSLGVSGLFQLQIDMYNQVGKPCPICGTTIKKIKVGGRGTCFCPHCQKVK